MHLDIASPNPKFSHVFHDAWYVVSKRSMFLRFPRGCPCVGLESRVVLYWDICHVVDRLERWTSPGTSLRILVKGSFLHESTGDFCFPFSFYNVARLCSRALASARLECCLICSRVPKASPSRDGGRDGEWPNNHAAILPASGHTKYGPKPQTGQPRD